MARHGKELSVALKKRVILKHQKGEGYKKIGDALHISKSTVAKIIQKYKNNGNTLSIVKRPGRQRKLSLRCERNVLRKVKENPKLTTPQLVEAIESQTGVTVSTSTVRRILHRDGMHGCRPRKKPLLKKRHKMDRLTFAKQYSDKPDAFWDSVLWSDETKINLFGYDGPQKVWRKAGEEYQEKCLMPTVKHGGGGVLLWGCMTAKGVGEIHFINGIMDSQVYCDILKAKMLPTLRSLGRQGLFQQDNDPKHSSRMTKAFLKKEKVKVMEWPSMSPDLNPIEHIWGVLKRKVSERKPKNITELKEVIQEEWKGISTETCQTLVYSMPRRICAVLNNKGGHTKY